jgi:AhpD family alkylhydroperoxidase
MEARMENPIMAVPGAMDIAGAMQKVLMNRETSIDLEWISLRASQINGCTWCLDMHSKALLKAGQPQEKLFHLPGWRDSVHFNDAERAALALTEAVTRMADQSDAVPDAVWEEAADQFSAEELGLIVLQAAAINFFNRVNVTIRQVTG